MNNQATSPGCPEPETISAFFDGELDLEKLGLTEAEGRKLIDELTAEMLSAAEALEFERAADLRDQIRALKKGK